MEKERIVLKVCSTRDNLNVMKWFKTFLLFTPTSMELGEITNYKYRKFKEKAFFDGVEKNFTEKKMSLDYNNGNENYVRLTQRNEYLDKIILSAILDKDIVDRNYDIITKTIFDIMSTSGIICHEFLLKDSFWQNNEDIDMYRIRNKSIKGVKLKQDPILKNRKIVDTQKLPGYQEYVESVLFGASRKMWFGKAFYQYVSKETLMNFSDCSKNEQLADDVICITLYDDMLDYDNPVNREKQWAFKKAINFDKLLEQLKKKPLPPSDPSLEINTGKFEHGGIRQMIYYLDADDNVTTKSRAVKKDISELDESGKVVHQEKVIYQNE